MGTTSSTQRDPTADKATMRSKTDELDSSSFARKGRKSLVMMVSLRSQKSPRTDTEKRLAADKLLPQAVLNKSETVIMAICCRVFDFLAASDLTRFYLKQNYY